MGWLINIIPAPLRIWAAVGLLAALLAAAGGAYVYVRHQGYQDGYNTAQATCEADKARQAAANRAALSAAEKRLAAQADALSLKNMDLDNAIDALSAAAAADPNGGDACLGSDSLLRLNSVR